MKEKQIRIATGVEWWSKIVFIIIIEVRCFDYNYVALIRCVSVWTFVNVCPLTINRGMASMFCWVQEIAHDRIRMSHTALLWQNEASDIPSKSELLTFSYFTKCAFLSGQILCINTDRAKRLGKTSWYSIDVSGNDRHILLFYKKWHFCHLLPFAKVGHAAYDCSESGSLQHDLFIV